MRGPPGQLRGVQTKVVIWLPVKLPVTGFNFQLPVTDIFSSRNVILGFSFVSHSHRRTKTGLHWTQTYRRRPTARSRWFRFTQYLTVESAPLPLPASGRRGRERREGRGANWMAGVDDTELGLE